VLVVCVVGIAYIALFVAIDATVEAYAETAQQMMIRLAVVTMALVGAVVLILSVAQRAEEQTRVFEERARLSHEQLEHLVQVAQEEARLQGVLVAIRELAPWLALDVPDVATAAVSARIMEASGTDLVTVQSGVASLTPREREVAGLIGQGRRVAR
jgi:hypothetical protein